MKTEALGLDGVHLLRAEPQRDERGAFARLWCRATLARAGIDFAIEQVSLSSNVRAGTLRGMHFAWPPSREAKILRCQRGRVHDVLLDLRPHSPSYLRHVAVVLDAEAHDALLVPHGVAHGFQALEDGSEVHYMMNEAFEPAWTAGVRFDDPRFAIAWPLPVSAISERDRQAPDFDDAAHRARWQRAAQEGGHAA